MSTIKSAKLMSEHDVEDDLLSLLAVDTLIIYRLLDCQNNSRNTLAGSKFKRPLDRGTTVMQACIAVGIETRPLDGETAVLKVCIIVAQIQGRVVFLSSRWIDAWHVST